MNFWERKNAYESGWIDKNIFERKPIKQHVGSTEIEKEIEKLILENSNFKREQIRLVVKDMLPKLKHSEVDDLYNLLMKFAIRIKWESE